MGEIKKIDWISKAKGFAILGIIAVHVAQQFELPYVSRFLFSGQFCVQLFFIISAYLSFKSSKLQYVCIGGGYGKYLSLKFFRLAPVLYISCLWWLIIECLKIRGIPSLRAAIWRDGLLAVTFLNGFSFHHINPWGNWYVGDLAIFLALTPFLKKMVNSLRSSLVLFVISVLVAYVSNYILVKCGVDTGWYFYFWLPMQFPALAVGIFFYYLETEESLESKKDVFYSFCFVASLGFLLSKCGLNILMEHIQYGILLFVFSYSLFSRKICFLNWLNVLGDNSYGIYLYHLCLLPLIRSFVRAFGFDKNIINFILCYFFAAIFSLLFSMITTHFVEKPLLRFMKRRFCLQ